jgi:hypothetical protein
MSSPRRPPHRPQRRTAIGPASRTHAYTAEAVSDDITDALSRASTEELLLELRRRIIRPRYRRQDWDDGDGLDASGGWPEEG